MASDSTIINMVGSVINPPSTSQTDQSTPPFGSGRQAEVLSAEVHGKWYTAAYRGALFTAQVDAVAILKAVNSVVSVFTLFNPTSSTAIAEMITTEIQTVAAATIVDAYGWYRPTPAAAAAGTFSTLGTAVSGRVGATAANQMLFYTAYTHNASLGIRVDLIGGVGATTNTVPGVIRKDYNGTFLIPPGNLISLLASTTDSTAVGDSIAVCWSEWPL